MKNFAYLTCLSTLCILNALWFAKVVPIYGDALYFESLYQHIVIRRDAFQSFWFTEALFFFPDFPIMLPLRLVSVNAAWGVCLYVFVGSAFQAAVLWAMFRRLWGETRSAFNVIVGVAIAFALGATSSIYRLFGFAPNHHASLWFLFVYWLWRLDMLAGAAPQALRMRHLAADLTLAIAFGFSDPLSIPAITAPALTCIALLTAFSTIEKKDGLRILFVTVIGLLSGWLLRIDLGALKYLSLPKTNLLTLSSPSLFKSMLRFNSSIAGVALDAKWIYAAFGAMLLATLVQRRSTAVCATTVKCQSTSTFTKFSLMSPAMALTATLVAGRWADEASARYVQGFYYVPLIWMAVCGLPRLRLPRAILAAALLTIVASWLWAIFSSPPGFRLLDKPPIAACLDAHVNKLPTPWGLSNFWISKAVTFTSRAGVVVNQVQENLEIYPWMNARSWYVRDQYDRSIKQYGFYVPITRHDEIRARQIWGEPDQLFKCDYDGRLVPIMIYRHGIAPF